MGLFFFLPLFLYSQEKSGEKIKIENLEKHLRYLTSDSLQGRRFGTKVQGLDKAANYIKNTIESYGLLSPDSGFFQYFTISSVIPDIKNTYFEIRKSGRRRIFSSDSLATIFAKSDTSIHASEIVFAGFGNVDEQTGYNDFKGLDVKGKMVLISAGNREMFLNEMPYSWNNVTETQKAKNAFLLGAVAVIFVNPPIGNGPRFFRNIIRENRYQSFSLNIEDTGKDPGNVFMISDKAADKILGKKGAFKKQMDEISKNKVANSFLIRNKSVSIQTKWISEEHNLKNVAGYIEGKDSLLKKGCLVFMAHYDHLGVSDKGEVFNGADDNGSGVSTLLEIARAFSENQSEIKRSVLFLWVSAEEVGLLGSAHYTNNPVFPIEKTLACINLDMVGRVYEPRDSVWRASKKPVKDFDGIYTLTSPFCPELSIISDSVCLALGLKPDNSVPTYFLTTSDHFNFHNKGIPILSYTTGYHADYHKTTDDFSKINFKKMKRIVELCFRMGSILAKKDKLSVIEQKQ